MGIPFKRTKWLSSVQETDLHTSDLFPSDKEQLGRSLFNL